MKFRLYITAILISRLGLCFAQDTVFHKKTAEYEIWVSTIGYHHQYLLKQQEIIDTLLLWEYGVYEKVNIADIVFANDKFVITYQTADLVGYIVRQKLDLKWTSIMGGPLKFIAKSTANFEFKIESPEKITLLETEKGASAPKVTTYVLDYVNKVISRQADK